VLGVATTDNSSGTFGLPGVGDGNLASPLPFSATGANWVTAGNFNADPLPDLAMADFVSSTAAAVTVLLNTTPAPSRPSWSAWLPAGHARRTVARARSR
jgi:hypothetical protein